ncbi:hypothetical protein BDW72DRAFT_196616 [Aspergillus terricola var. indicus]
MSTNEADSRRAVTARIAEAGADNVAAMVDAGRSSQQKRKENRAGREAKDNQGSSDKPADTKKSG